MNPANLPAMRRRFALGLLMALPAFAAGASVSPGVAPVLAGAPAQGANFLVPGAIDASALLPAPPAPDSLVQRAELDVLLHLQAGRTPAQVARARLVEQEDLFVFGSAALGPWFDAAHLPRTAAFFALVGDDMNTVSRATKKLFHRRRPPFLDARIKPCVEFADTGSYPSGHALRSTLWAGLLGAIYPERAAALEERAAETRWCRLLAGVHNPSDVEAGRILGEAMVRALLKNPAVQKALPALRAEAAPFLAQKAA